MKGWLATYLYYSEPIEHLLQFALKPFVEAALKDGQAQGYFFIRYWDRGPHIRLRFYGDTDQMDTILKPRLEKVFGQYMKENPSQRDEPDHATPADEKWFPNNSIQYLPYEPEYFRYGGKEGMPVSEKQFELSSDAVLAILEESGQWDYERALGAAIQLHLGFSFALDMSLQEMGYFWSWVFKGWFPRAVYRDPDMSEAALEKSKNETMAAFEENFDRQKDNIIGFHEQLWEAFRENIEIEQEWLVRWISGMREIGKQLAEKQEKGLLEFRKGWFEMDEKIGIPLSRQQLWIILESYVHMTNNRLGILNRDEGFLGYLIMESVKAMLEANPDKNQAGAGL